MSEQGESAVSTPDEGHPQVNFGRATLPLEGILRFEKRRKVREIATLWQRLRGGSLIVNDFILWVDYDSDSDSDYDHINIEFSDNDALDDAYDKLIRTLSERGTIYR